MLGEELRALALAAREEEVESEKYIKEAGTQFCKEILGRYGECLKGAAKIGCTDIVLRMDDFITHDKLIEYFTPEPDREYHVDGCVFNAALNTRMDRILGIIVSWED